MMLLLLADNGLASAMFSELVLSPCLGTPAGPGYQILTPFLNPSLSAQKP